VNATIVTRSLRGLIALATAILPPAWAQDAARNEIQSVDFSAAQSGRVIVRIGLKSALPAPPTSFAVTNPARIAFDLPDTTNAVGRPLIEAGVGDLRNVSLVEAGGRTRLVMNLARSVPYSAAIDGRALVVTLDPSSLAAAPAAGPASTPATASAPTAPALADPTRATAAARAHLVDIDFRRGNAGEGRVVVDLSSASTGIDIRQQGRLILVDFLNSGVPKNLIRRLDVGDFGTPVRFVDAFEQSGNARLVIEPRGVWEYAAYQTDNQFILEVKPQREDPNRLVPGATTAYAGERLSLNFQNVEVRAVLQVIADFTGLNIITSESVSGSLTLRLKDVPWDQALDIILQAKGLAKRKNGNVVLIAPATELAAKEKQALEEGLQISELEPLRTESFPLSYADARALRALLSDKDQKILSKRGSATFDERTNTLFVQDSSRRLEEARRLVQQLDVPVRQVVIEARIVIADDKWSRNLGARFGGQAAYNRGPRNYGLSGTLTDTTAATGGAISRGSASLANPTFSGNANMGPQGAVPSGGQSEQLNVNLPITPAAGQLALTILNLGSGNLVNIELSALEAENRGKVVSSPRVITADKKQAIISQGTQIPYQNATQAGATAVEFKDAVLELRVTPRITPDDRIIMDLAVKKDSVGQVFNGVPSIDKKQVQTQVLCDNGDTIVLGGIFEQTTRTTVDKVPMLGDIPLMGNLFKRTLRQDDKTELLVFVTPKIIKDSLAIR